MAETRKRNEFLDIASSDDEATDRGYDSEAAEESKGRTVKRRRTKGGRGGSLSDGNDTHASEGISSDEEEGGVAIVKGKGKGKAQAAKDKDALDDEDQEEEDDTEEGFEGEEQYLDVSAEPTTTDKTSKKTKLDKPPKKNKSGIVYLSSLPPYLKPHALSSMLQQRGFGPITKIFLAPEVKSTSAPRGKSSSRKKYTDGWVEFKSKKTAKICAETMNASIIGGRKGSWYHDDILNIRYLKNFKWNDLMETIQRERREREARQRIEDARSRKEDKVFLAGVEEGKVLDGIQKKNEEKRKRKMQTEGGDGGDREPAQKVKVRRVFKQNEVKTGRDKLKGEDAAIGADTQRVLGKIF